MGLIPAHAGKTHRSRSAARRPRAHPRSRGENLTVTEERATAWGSSPLTRGKPSRCGLHRLCRGLIPAHAGKTELFEVGERPPWAHPRSRGENSTRRELTRPSRGSSPLTRGKLGHCAIDCHVSRLIPAHAGKTSESWKRLNLPQAHPRSRGENAPGRRRRKRARGSSPLTRGKRARSIQRRNSVRLIPAHAGKTDHGATGGARSGAHPRSRGENAFQAAKKVAARGSSPLTRGKPPPGQRRPHGRGLIPAHAGKTNAGAAFCRAVRAHPRSRGENGKASAVDLSAMGSSPLTRGKPAAKRASMLTGGLIPAHAGKTGGGPRRGRGAWAHPRSRGENCCAALIAASVRGSSPLTRGKQPYAHHNNSRRGLIPAHAGKTHETPTKKGSSGAHPRSRGENILNLISGITANGSSPLTPGKHQR